MSDWSTDDTLYFRGPLDMTRAATAVLDARGVIIGWSPTAENLLGYPPGQVIGSRVDTLLLNPADPGASILRRLRRTERSKAFDVRHRDGRMLRVATTMVPLADGVSGPAWLLAAAHLGELHDWDSHQAMLQGLVTQSPIGLAIYDTDIRLAWANAASGLELDGPLESYVGTPANDLYPGGVVTPGYPKSLQEVMRRVLETGEPVVDLHFRGRPPADPEHDYIWSCSYYRLMDARGQPLGVCEDAYDITERYRSEQRLALLVRAGARLGATLDVAGTAREVAGVCVPDFADAVHVDVQPEVIDGGEPGADTGARPLVCVARQARSGSDAAADPRSPHPGRDDLVTHPPGTPQASSLAGGTTSQDDARPGDDAPTRLVVPLRSPTAVMGLVTFLRDHSSGPFGPHDVELAEELVGRAAVSMDNARRYTRERNATLTLQRSLLPQRLPVQTAVEVSHRYLPADNVAGVGGDWFDVIPLSGARVALVVGDVVGHGLRAAATMGRLRATVRALAHMDFAPDELLTRLDDLVRQTAEEVAEGVEGGEGRVPDQDHEDEAFGVTCIFAVYDPVSGRFSAARAGHLPPAIVRPGTGPALPDVPPGPPLGLGGLPFESIDVQLPEGTLVALFTDGLVEVRGQDIDVGLRKLQEAVSEHTRSLEELCDRAVATLRPNAPTADDAALLLVRTRMLSDRQVVLWDLPATPESVGCARATAARQLAEWGLDRLSFTTELVVSELVTNAVRHASGPVQLRLIRDRTLLCEVSDTGHTSPHLRHAAQDDEGGRGLFIVAQLVHKWGTRYTTAGKTIWTEQDIPG
ncbi:SpoIIE family protein phosphatase [Streptomyces meridianus]|uniref:SpoIIE family protein phosphatase n=1 Tax=Streptomyces meridianus TaxID=2938945 RepID=A0ABT0XCT8_9ACTN|nr:SpoIIE family protein phosphatase [Streptomyces meridianus]MCM2580331.1 SpoIIE family protein phosphatase [Streptomyces meridianus]